MKVESVVGRFAEKVISQGRVELDLNDRKRFPLGVLGLYEGKEVEGDGGEGIIEEDEREVK
jgi:hypothetical protein